LPKQQRVGRLPKASVVRSRYGIAKVLQFDFRVGGTYRFAYHVPGEPTMIVNGAYRAIELPSKIVFSWNIEPPDEHAGLKSEVIVTITPDGAGAELWIRHEKLAQPGALERHAQGWHGALDQLTTLLDAAAAAATRNPAQ